MSSHRQQPQSEQWPRTSSTPPAVGVPIEEPQQTQIRLSASYGVPVAGIPVAHPVTTSIRTESGLHDGVSACQEPFPSSCACHSVPCNQASRGLSLQVHAISITDGIATGLVYKPPDGDYDAPQTEGALGAQDARPTSPHITVEGMLIPIDPEVVERARELEQVTLAAQQQRRARNGRTRRRSDPHPQDNGRASDEEAPAPQGLGQMALVLIDENQQPIAVARSRSRRSRHRSGSDADTEGDGGVTLIPLASVGLGGQEGHGRGRGRRGARRVHPAGPVPVVVGRAGGATSGLPPEVSAVLRGAPAGTTVLIAAGHPGSGTPTLVAQRFPNGQVRHVVRTLMTTH